MFIYLIWIRKYFDLMNYVKFILGAYSYRYMVYILGVCSYRYMVYLNMGDGD